MTVRLSQGPGRLLAAAPSNPFDSQTLPPGAAEHATGLNNMDVCAEFTARLRSELDSTLFGGSCSRLFSNQQDRERIRSILADLSKTAGDLRQAVTKALEQMAESALPRMKSVLDEVASVIYVLNEAEYSAREEEEGWAHRMIVSLQGTVGWLQPFMTTGNYEGLFHILVDKILARLEAMLGRKGFSQLGGLLLERDVRTMLSGLQELSTRTVRDKLSRLTQMALLLGLEAVEEVLDYWSGGGGMTWRLSPSEVRAVLLQRTDFAQTKDAVMALTLHI